MKINSFFLLMVAGAALLSLAYTHHSINAPERNEILSDIAADENEFVYVVDENIQSRLDAAIMSKPEWVRLVKNKKMAVGIVDLREEGVARYAYVNGQHMMYAASLPKIAVLLAAADAIDKCDLEFEGAVKKDMKQMIAKSNNAATTRMIDRLGFDKIKKVLTHPENRFYDVENGGGLWVGKRYAAAGKRMPDPLKGLSHAATVEQVCRYYHKLYNNDLVSEQGSEIMKSCLIDPQIHHKFVNTLDKVAPEAKVYRKSGSWKNFHSDSALVVGEGNRKYIIVALIEANKGGQICKDFVYTAEQVLGVG